MEMPSNCCDQIVADDGSGRMICEFPYGLDANSAHIVRVVNAHDDLVAALRELIDDADASGVTAYFNGRGFDESIEKARAALAKAEGGAK
jgi:hypothetical protein